VPAELAQLWGELLESVSHTSPFLRNYLLKAFPLALDRGELKIGFTAANAQFMPLVDNARNREALTTALKSLGVADARVKFVPSETAPFPPAPATAAPEKATPVTTPATITAPVPSSPAAEASPSTPAAKSAKTAPTKLDPAAFKDDPLIQQALTIFKGRVVQAVAPAAAPPS
jgi:hypothetical protein